MRTLPNATDVVARSQLAAVKATEATSTVAGVDPARLAKAADGVVSRGSNRIADYFDRNVAHPFSESGRTMPIEIATVPQWFGVTSLGKELRAAHGDDARLKALTEPLQKLLDGKGFGAHFNIANVGDIDDCFALCVTLTKKDAA